MANERRLIDREALLEDIEAAEKNGGMSEVVAGTLKRYVKRQPTVDAVEVVRCAKCKHYEEPYCMLCKSRIGASYWSRDMAYRKPDDFCSYGKKSGTQPQREDV